tara:strand:- start:118 stop:441 length:324 start_codon:yes stop_codon:yes gene_type:complete
MEIYFVTLYYSPTKDVNNSSIKNKFINISQDKQDFELLDEYIIKGDKKITHGAGKIMINKDYNIFINAENYDTLMKKDLIYKVDTPFELEILNLSAENINYYYIANN